MRVSIRVVASRVEKLTLDDFVEGLNAEERDAVRAEAKAAVQSLRERSQQTAGLTRWVESLAPDRLPDYSVYEGDEYIGELWACWCVYSKKYLLDIQKGRSLPPLGVAASLGDVRVVLDLGCGLGLTSALLVSMFPGARVVATNLLKTKQAGIAGRLGKLHGFELVESLEAVGGPVDVVFASEYFEHMQQPVAHLREVLRHCCPRSLLIANTFTKMAVGHFELYDVDGEWLKGAAVSKAFNNELRRSGYEKVQTKLWNGRPAYWRKANG